MLSNHKLQLALNDIKEISRMELLLYDEKGRLLASTEEPDEKMEESIVHFSESMAESQMMQGYHFFKVYVEETLQYVLLIRANSEEAYMVGRLAVVQIRNIVESYHEQFDRNVFIQNILLGNILLVDMYNKAEKLKIMPAKRLVYVVEILGRKESVQLELLRNLVDGKHKDFVTEVDEKNLILVKDVSKMEESDYETLAREIVDGFNMEAMVQVRVGYGTPVERLQDLQKSYQEAMMALQVGGVFYVQKRTMSYSKLGIGRLIYQLPIQLCEMFIEEVFGDRELNLDEETLSTVERFFENDLNISETARQLYVHRNTLVYRLDRFEKIVGLDVRKFEDAMKFKLAMMVIAHMKQQSPNGREE